MKSRLFSTFITLAFLTIFVCSPYSVANPSPAPPGTAVEVPPIQESIETLEAKPTAEPPLDLADNHAREPRESPEAAANRDSTEAREAHTAEKETAAAIPEGSVLHLIPEQITGLLYCSSLLELDYRINRLMTDLSPTDEAPEVLAQILANAFGAEFESLNELKEIGLDLKQDFVIFFTNLGQEPMLPWRLSAAIHLTDPEAMMEIIETESQGSTPTEYNGVNYWKSSEGGGNFAILDNILVFSQSPTVCENTIDAYNGSKQAIIANPRYSPFLADIAGQTAQLTAYLDIEVIAPILNTALKKEIGPIKDALGSDPTSMAMIPFFEGVFDITIDIVEQLESLSVTLEIRGTDVQLAPSLMFKNDSDIQRSLKNMSPDALTILNTLPNPVFVNGAFQGKKQLLFDMSTYWLRALVTSREQENPSLDTLIQQMAVFAEALGNEWGLAVNFSDSIIPNLLYIYEVTDRQQAETYMDNQFLQLLHDLAHIGREMGGNTSPMAMYDGAYAGIPLMHNNVEIKSYVLPNFSTVLGDIPPEAAAMMPQEWRWYYTFHENRMFFALGNPDLIKTVLDRASGIGESFADDMSYRKLAETFGTDNNLFLALSPMTLVKNLLSVIAKANPAAGPEMQMLGGMFANAPERYSLGFSAKVEDNGGIDAKLLLALGDFKQIIQMIMMMQNMGQMQ